MPRRSGESAALTEPLTLTLSPEAMELIAARAAELAAEIVAERLASQDDAGPRWLTLEQAAERLGCSSDAVRMRVKRGRLKGEHQGRRLYVSAASVDRLS